MWLLGYLQVHLWLKCIYMESAGLGILSHCKCKEMEMQTYSVPTVGTKDTAPTPCSLLIPLTLLSAQASDY